ncbi:lysylphosphatidylglycerol synthase transmembrane domain-containing protein [Fluviicola taffensis]|uniref:Putative transmembrane protein n=1 Tax=Fluviicola taffensis (strain DSM 16823 / NCIMB 13979 / RW262) TaxID=755732 RepID=F2IJK3_FLUTR|nr:lysylphosphatidylglycerol synthase transmembrane domain-containing protein [Fluviicola taffensis]AEA42891.1 putative transmembrane protein [Fluviicola taffensis DSM 16823]
MKKVAGVLLKTVFPLVLGVYLIWFLFQSMDEEVKQYFYKALREANYFWVFLSLLLSFFALLSRAYRWKYLLEPMGYKTSFWNRYHAVVIGYIVNLTIPRAGEATRSGMLYRSDGVPFSKSFGTILAERVFDLIMLLIIAISASFIGAGDFWKIKELIEASFSSSPESSSIIQLIKWIVIGLFLLGFAIVFLVKKIRLKIIGFIKGLISGVLSVFKTKKPFSFLGHTLLIWILYIVYFGVCFLALPETSTMNSTGILLAFIAGSLGISLTNGGIGVFPLVVGLVVEYYLKDQYGSQAQGIGYALGMIIWSSQTLMIILLGLLSFYLLPKNYSKDGDIRENQE